MDQDTQGKVNQILQSSHERCFDQIDLDDELYRSLLICKGIVDLYQGEISLQVTTSNGSGLIFYFSMHMRADSRQAHFLRHKSKKNSKKELIDHLSIVEEKVFDYTDSSKQPGNRLIGSSINQLLGCQKSNSNYICDRVESQDLDSISKSLSLKDKNENEPDDDDGEDQSFEQKEH